MADVLYNTKIGILREKSRTLLVQLAENTKIVESEIKKLNIDRNISPSPCISEFNKKTLSSWLIRNDSRRVSELLNPSNEEMTVGGRILIASTRLGDSMNPRQAVPGCYCQRIPRKIQYRSARSIFKPFELGQHCTSHVHVPVHNIDEPDEAPSSPGINAETRQRVQSITYTPRSEFLRRVQKKVSQPFNTCAEQSEITSQLSNQHSSHAFHENQGNNSDYHESRQTGGGSNRILYKYQTDSQAPRQNEFISLHDESTIIDPHAGERIQVPVQVHRANNSGVSVYHESRERIPQVPEILNVPEEKRSSHVDKSKQKEKSIQRKQGEFSPEIEIILPPKVLEKKSIKSIPKITISSTKHNDEKKNHKKENSTERRKKNGQRKRYDSCCLASNKPKKSAIFSKCGDCCCHADRPCILCLAPLSLSPKNDCNNQVDELRKFREKNYYDTHDSSQTVLPSAILSSGTLKKFELNNRLFPEPIGEVHRDNIMISMPPCATKQLKSIHYFPRYIVREDKKSPIHNSNEKRKHQSCPLAGHAIDVARLEPACLSNSLALKYQKGTM